MHSFIPWFIVDISEHILLVSYTLNDDFVGRCRWSLFHVVPQKHREQRHLAAKYFLQNVFANPVQKKDKMLSKLSKENVCAAGNLTFLGKIYSNF